MQKTNHPNSQIVFFFLNKHSMQALVQHWKKSIANGGNRVEKQSFVAENSLYVSVVISMEINRRHSFQSNLRTSSMSHHPSNAVILIIGTEKKQILRIPFVGMEQQNQRCSQLQLFPRNELIAAERSWPLPTLKLYQHFRARSLGINPKDKPNGISVPAIFSFNIRE